VTKPTSPPETDAPDVLPPLETIAPSKPSPNENATFAPGPETTDTCACQPQKYEFTLDFAITCSNSLTVGPGIDQVGCVVEPIDEGDQIPVNVTSIEIAEVDQKLQDLNPVIFEGEYENGFAFEYTSAIAGGVTVPPKGIKMIITGTNLDGVELVNTWLILFTNDCENYPVLTDGSQIGWTVLVSLMLLLLCFGYRYLSYISMPYLLQDFCVCTSRRSLPGSDDANIGS
jgi:hypothetical protein